MQKGFTLSELLITLGIIGVVAAVTMPVLIKKYQERVFNVQFRKAYTTITNAHAKAVFEYGTNPRCYYGKNGISDDFSECREFSQLFLQELKIAKDCGYNAMLNGCIPRYKGRDEIKGDDGRTGCYNMNTANLEKYPAYILNDGTIIMSAINDKNRISVNTIVDINGQKGPNKWGYDVFYFYTYFDGNKYIKESTGGCMFKENGGRMTHDMVEYVLSH